MRLSSQVKTKESDYEASGIYATIGSPPKETNLDFSRSSSNWLNTPMQSTEYEVPVKGETLKKGSPQTPGTQETLTRCNTYEVPTLSLSASQPNGGVSDDTRYTETPQPRQLEASNVYETPLDAAKRRNGDGGVLTQSGDYEVPVNSGRQARAANVTTAAGKRSGDVRTGENSARGNVGDEDYTPMASVLEYVHSATSSPTAE